MLDTLGHHYHEILDMILDVLRVSLSRNVGYDFIAKMFDTILDVLRASLSRNIGYNFGCIKGVIIAKF